MPAQPTGTLQGTRQRPYSLTLLLLMFVLLAAGCSLHCETRHDLALQQQAALPSWHTDQNKAEKVGYLTDLIKAPAVTALIKEALAKNPDLQQTLITLKQAYTSWDNTSGNSIPSFGAGYSAQKGKNSDTNYTANLSVTWELDFWGRLADMSRAAEFNIKAAAFSLQQAQDVLAADIIRTWLDIALYHQLIQIQKERVTRLTSNHQLIISQYQKGLGDLDDLDSAKSSVQKARSILEGYYQNQITATRTLHLLLGHTQQNTPFDVSSGFPRIILPLATLPEQNLGGRPDLQKAYMDIQAKEQTASAAYKALLPSFSLTGKYYDSGKTLRDSLFTNPLWSLLGELSAPIFNGGKLRAQAKSADLDIAKSYYAYKGILLNAINEVENYLDVEITSQTQEKLLTSALKSGEQSLANYTDKYRQGLATIYELISAQTNAMDLKVSLINKKYDRLKNRVNLGLALGLGVNHEAE